MIRLGDLCRSNAPGAKPNFNCPMKSSPAAEFNAPHAKSVGPPRPRQEFLANPLPQNLNPPRHHPPQHIEEDEDAGMYGVRKDPDLDDEEEEEVPTKGKSKGASKAKKETT